MLATFLICSFYDLEVTPTIKYKERSYATSDNFMNLTLNQGSTVAESKWHACYDMLVDRGNKTFRAYNVI